MSVINMRTGCHQNYDGLSDFSIKPVIKTRTFLSTIYKGLESEAQASGQFKRQAQPSVSEAATSNHNQTHSYLQREKHGSS